MSPATPGGSPCHALSFDVEEYFQVANLAHHFPRAEWDAIPSRLDLGMDPILAALERHGARATFFFLGWVAERRPDLVRRCLAGGHEIASHGYDHRFLGELGPEGLDADLARTEELLMAAGAPRPRGFRACTFTLTRETWWAFDVLARRGYTYDSSVHPVHHPTYGVPDFPPLITPVSAAAAASAGAPAGTPGEARTILEFPVTTLPWAGRNLPVGGGGYLRLAPGALHRAALRRVVSLGRPLCLYLHPWEFDPAQPRVPAPLLSTFRHRVGLGHTAARLEALLGTFNFLSLGEVLSRQPEPGAGPG
ncbi:MAG TPA: XrtA system polysaccharide deacetylase [Planctomycetota bacterium]|nr:XrtA system polysaccharide deacetylase [Planctomycetota bacterium]